MGVGEADFQGLPTAMVSILPARPTSCYNRLAVSAESGRVSRLQLTPGRPAFCPLPKDLAACGRGCHSTPHPSRWGPHAQRLQLSAGPPPSTPACTPGPPSALESSPRGHGCRCRPPVGLPETPPPTCALISLNSATAEVKPGPEIPDLTPPNPTNAILASQSGCGHAQAPPGARTGCSKG